MDNDSEEGIFSSSHVEGALLAVDRGDFCPSQPYQDHPMGIGYNATISAPHMHATSLQLLKDHLVEGSRVLDVGSGSGYLTACMALMVGVTGRVVGIEHVHQLVELGRSNIHKHHSSLLNSGRITLVEGDGRRGYPITGGYHAIHVGAAAPTVPREEFMQIDREGDEYRQKCLHGVIYVPLTSKEQQLKRR